MYCPHCGQQQVTGEVRFCPRCGLPLTVVADVVASGGNLPAYNSAPNQISAKRRGVKQGATLFLSGAVLVPILGVLSAYLDFPEMFIAMAALICFLGGVVRMLFAALFEEGAPKPQALVPVYMQPPTQPVISAPPRIAALPPQQATPISTYNAPRPNTAEIYQRPPSVTEGTTKLLEREKEPTE